VGQLGPYLAVVEFFMGLRDWSGGLGWEVVVPCDRMIECRSALLTYPCMLLLCMEASARILKEVFLEPRHIPTPISIITILQHTATNCNKKLSDFLVIASHVP